MKYRVTVQRTDYVLGEITVEAPNEEEAHDAALQAAMEGDADVLGWNNYETLEVNEA